MTYPRRELYHSLYRSALEETAYLLRSPRNARRLLESIAELEAGGGAAHELADEDEALAG